MEYETEVVFGAWEFLSLGCWAEQSRERFPFFPTLMWKVQQPPARPLQTSLLSCLWRRGGAPSAALLLVDQLVPTRCQPRALYKSTLAVLNTN